MTHGEYSGRGKPERITAPRTPVPQREAPASPAEISTVDMLIEEGFDRLYARITSGSRADMRTETRKQTRPLYAIIAAIVGAMGTGGAWVCNAADNWNESQRKAWAVEAKQLEQDEAMAAHLSEAHVSPARIEAIEARLGHIEAKLGELLERTAKLEPAPTKRGR